MCALRRRTKARRFFIYSTRKLDVKGLSATLGRVKLPNVKIELGSVQIEPERQNLTNELMRLDLLQWSLTKDVEALSGKNIRDQKLQEIMDVKIQMLKLIEDYSREGEGH